MATKKTTTKTATKKKNAATKKKAPRSPLTRETVLAAAIAVADDEGLEAVTMRRVATALGVEAMSLYHHVGSKEGLLDGLVEQIVATLPVPTPLPDWREAMRARAVAAHAALLAHPWATSLFVSRLNVGPNMLRYVDATIGVLRAAGFSWADCDHVWNVVDAYVYGFTLQTAHFPLEAEAYASSAQAFLPMIPHETHPHLRGLSLEVIAGRHDGKQHLGFGLELLLDGIERRRRC